MLANALETYESWDLKKLAIPSRSRLYQLEPIGIGTPYVESLTGYISRLAEAPQCESRGFNGKGTRNTC